MLALQGQPLVLLSGWLLHRRRSNNYFGSPVLNRCPPTQCTYALQERVNDDIAQKEMLRGAIVAQLETQMTSCRDLERECAALVSRARHTSGKLMVWWCGCT